MKNNTKYFLFGLSLLCICMIGITTIRGSILNPLRTAVGYVLVPIQSGVNRVGGGLYNELSSVGKLKTALAENETLKTRVDELTEENTRLRSEQFELERLRSLYELDQEYMQYHKIATDITVDYNDNLTKSGYLIPAARFDRLQEVLVITDLKDAGPEINE